MTKKTKENKNEKIKWIELDWVVKELLPGWYCKVFVEELGYDVRAKLSWRMKRNNISVIAWDKVKVEINPYDFTMWVIIYRY